MHVANLDETMGGLAGFDVQQAIEAGFVAYSESRANVPTLGELLMDKEEANRFNLKHSKPRPERPLLGGSAVSALTSAPPQATDTRVGFVLSARQISD